VTKAKKLHRFADCGADQGDGDRSDGNLTGDVRRVTCGTCKARILNTLARADWSQLTSLLTAELHYIAVKVEKETR